VCEQVFFVCKQISCVCEEVGCVCVCVYVCVGKRESVLRRYAVCVCVCVCVRVYV